MRAFDPETYGVLLATRLPSAIESDAEHDRLLEEVNRLVNKTQLSLEEEKLLMLIADIIQAYEARIHAPRVKSAPHEMLAFIIKERGLKQKDLLPVFGSESIVSEVLRGKRGITARQARASATFFHTSVDLFI